MKTPQLGRLSLTVSELGLGCMGLGFDRLLTSDDMRQIDKVFAAIGVKGAPLSERLTAIANR